MKLNSYLIFDGCCADAFRFYERVLGGTRLMLSTFGDSPMASRIPEEWRDKIIHARLEIGDDVLMGSDGMPGQHEKAQGFSVSVQVADPATAEPIFHALAEGGAVRMPFQKTYWSAGFGMLVDRYGTPWMVNCEAPEANAESDRDFVISRTFDAPRDVVWRAWTEREQLMQWFGPKGCTISAATLDLRACGSFHYGMRAPDGSMMWGKWTFRDIVAPEKIVLVTSFSDEHGGVTVHPMNPSWPRETLATTTFVEHEGKTTISVRWATLNATAGEQATFDANHDSMRGGWGGTFEQLEEYLARAKSGAA